MDTIPGSTGTAGNHDHDVVTEIVDAGTPVPTTPIQLALLLAADGIPVRPDVPARPGSGPTTELPEVAERFVRCPEAGVVAVVNGVELVVPVGVVPSRTELELQAREEWEGRNRRSGSRKRFPIIHGSEIEHRPPPDWQVEGVLVRGSLGLMFGPSETYKSFLAIDLAACVATGTGWHGHEISKPGRVLYVLAEDSADTGMRVEAWRAEQGVEEVQGLDWVPEPVNLWSGDVEALIAQVEGEAYVLVVIDTLARSMAGGDENSARDMGEVVRACDELRRRLGASVLLVHHTGKDGRDARGSSALRGAVDMAMKVTTSPSGEVFIVCDKLKMLPHFPAMSLAPTSSGRSVVLVDTGDDAPSGNTIEVYSALGDDWATVAEIMAATGLKDRAVQQHLKGLLESQMAERDPKDDKRGVQYRWRRSRG